MKSKQRTTVQLAKNVEAIFIPTIDRWWLYEKVPLSKLWKDGNPHISTWVVSDTSPTLKGLKRQFN